VAAADGARTAATAARSAASARAMEVAAPGGAHEFRQDRWNGAWAAERSEQAALMRDLVGHLFYGAAADSAWLTAYGGTVAMLAQAIYDERAFDRLPILADILEEAGCTDPYILAHCRGPGPHVRGCWVVDLLSGKE
jgi:hypothetical protein